MVTLLLLFIISTKYYGYFLILLFILFFPLTWHPQKAKINLYIIIFHFNWPFTFCYRVVCKFQNNKPTRGQFWFNYLLSGNEICRTFGVILFRQYCQSYLTVVIECSCVYSLSLSFLGNIFILFPICSNTFVFLSRLISWRY